MRHRPGHVARPRPAVPGLLIHWSRRVRPGESRVYQVAITTWYSSLPARAECGGLFCYDLSCSAQLLCCQCKASASAKARSSDLRDSYSPASPTPRSPIGAPRHPVGPHARGRGLLHTPPQPSLQPRPHEYFPPASINTQWYRIQASLTHEPLCSTTLLPRRCRHPLPQVHRAILRGRIPVAVKLLTGAGGADGSITASLIEELQIMSRVPDHRRDLDLTRSRSAGGDAWLSRARAACGRLLHARSEGTGLKSKTAAAAGAPSIAHPRLRAAGTSCGATAAARTRQRCSSSRRATAAAHLAGSARFLLAHLCHLAASPCLYPSSKRLPQD